MAKKFGRKVRRSKSIYKRRKGSLRRFTEIAAMVVIVAGLGFVGWTAGKAIRDFFQQENEEQLPVDNGQLPINEPDNADEPDIEENPQTDDLPTVAAGFNAVNAPSSVLDNSTSLAAYIQQAKNNAFDAIVLEMKDSVGHLFYASDYEPVKNSEIMRGSLTAAQIYDAFEGTGVKPIVRINTLLDRLSPAVLEDVSYVFASGGGWLDNRIESGGKRWANPFLQGTRDYHAFIINELAEAGFTDIILANVIFPEFRAYDLGVLASEYTNASTRHEGLAGFVSALSQNTSGVRFILEMTLVDVVENYAGFNNSAEILRARRTISDFELLLIYNRDDFGAEYKTGESSSVMLPANDMSALMNLLFKQAGNQASGFGIIPGLNRENLTDREIADILKTFGELEFDSFVIR